jgi:hypothetical protein
MKEVELLLFNQMTITVYMDEDSVLEQLPELNEVTGEPTILEGFEADIEWRDGGFVIYEYRPSQVWLNWGDVCAVIITDVREKKEDEEGEGRQGAKEREDVSPLQETDVQM